MVERHEEPFAEKRVTANEEIVVRNETVKRPETVRETQVEVEEEPAATAARTTTTTNRTAGTTPRTPAAPTGSRFAGGRPVANRLTRDPAPAGLTSRFAVGHRSTQWLEG